jgi:2,3-bisphosphoglycerate-independent phosphoglycerate mutase
MINYAMSRKPDGSIDYSLRIPHTTHTTDNLTPLVLMDDDYVGHTLRAGGKLGDVAPTMLKLLGINQPEPMTGESLL